MRYAEYQKLSRSWYKKFEHDRVNPALNKYRNGTINDSRVRQDFLNHAKDIFDHYNIKDKSSYTNFLQSFNELLEKVKESTTGFASLIFGFLDSSKRVQKSYAQFIKLMNREIPNEAHRDFVLLLQRYLNFFIVERECQAEFESTTLNSAFKKSAEDMRFNLMDEFLRIEVNFERFEREQFEKAKRTCTTKEIQIELKAANKSSVSIETPACPKLTKDLNATRQSVPLHVKRTSVTQFSAVVTKEAIASIQSIQREERIHASGESLLVAR